MEEEVFKYYAFISYSHKDKKIAKRLHKRLQSYHLPSKLQKSCPGLPKKLTPVFIDESNLVGIGLQEALQKNLDSSNYLIVICSPNSAESKYVNQEVAHFIELGRKSHIIPLIVDGEPHSKDPSKECFPPALLALQEEYEILGIDLKKFGVRDSFLRVIATMLGIDLDNFISWEARERKRKRIIFASVAAIFIIIEVMLVTLIWHDDDRLPYNDRAQYNIGITYYDKRDYVQAMEWFERAAANGNTNAQTLIGHMYVNGLGVKPDYAKAIEWYEKAAVNDNATSQNNIDDKHYEEIEQDYAKVLEWYEKASASGDSYAQNNIGNMYEEGLYVKQDYTKAMEWYKKAASQGNSEAQKNIGYMYMNGLGVKQDYVKAMEWFEKAAAQGNAVAQNNIGSMYLDGLGVKQDYSKAMEWYEKAANQGSTIAQNNIGNMYVNGWGVEQDYIKAKEWFEKAAANGYSESQFNIGYMYENGFGVEQDYAKAIEWYEKAIANGEPNAQNNLDRLMQKISADKTAN